MGAEVQYGMGAEVLAQPAVESGERMGRRKSLLEQQAHRVAFVPERRLDTDKHIAETLTQHEDAAAITLLLAWRRAPLGLDFP